MNPLPRVLIVSTLLVGLATAATFRSDIEYGSAAGETLLLDACVPEGPGPFPAVILVHGGAWTRGDKSGGPAKGYMAPLHEPLTQAGIAWFSINYRLAPKHRFPACVEDLETAIVWVKAHAGDFCIDPRRLALSGESAGAHIVAMAVVRARPGTAVAAVVPVYGPFDLASDAERARAISPTMRDLFGLGPFDDAAVARLREGSPLLHLRSGLPPFLLVHGDADNRVNHQQSVTMQARLREVGVPCDLITIREGGHGMPGWDKLGSDFRAQITAWLVSHLAGPAGS